MPEKPRPELIRARQIRGLSQLDVARKLQVEPKAVSCWERGVYSARVRNIVALASLYDVPVETVERWFGLEPPPHIEAVNGVDPVTLAEAKLIAHAAYREAMRAAGLSISKTAEIRANADLFIKGFEVAQDQSTDPHKSRLESPHR